jgi:hypothetical protein
MWRDIPTTATICEISTFPVSRIDHWIVGYCFFFYYRRCVCLRVLLIFFPPMVVRPLQHTTVGRSTACRLSPLERILFVLWSSMSTISWRGWWRVTIIHPMMDRVSQFSLSRSLSLYALFVTRQGKKYPGRREDDVPMECWLLNEQADTGIDYRCDNEKITLELGRHLSIIA